jgi:hypothetical protein
MYGCNSCAEQFAQSQHLERHRRSKHGGQRFVCTHCSFTCNRKDSLNRHMSLKHGADTEQTGGRVNYLDTESDAQSDTEDSSAHAHMQNHMATTNEVCCPYPIIERDALYFKQFKCPTTVCISGTTNSGKTYFVKQLLENKNEMFNPPADKVMYCYGVWQSLFEDMEKQLDIMFHKGLPNEETVDTFVNGNHNIIILDDLMDDVVESKGVQNMFTRGSHHKNLTVLYLNQNMYCQGKSARSINLNTHYMVLMRNPRDTSQISVLAKQTGLGKNLIQSYKECTSKPYGYLVVDLSPHSNDSIKLKTDILPEQYTIAYV